MSASRGLFVAFAVSAAMTAGCNAILGNDVHDLDPNAVALGAGGSAGAIGQSSGGRGGSTSGSGAGGSVAVTTDASTGDVTGITDDAASIGRDVDIGDRGAGADAACAPRTTDCQGSTLVQCASGQWAQVMQCPFVCLNGTCSGTCVPGQLRCNDNKPESCDAAGNWQGGAACPNVCVLGQCTGSCKPNSTQSCGSAGTCNANAVQTCDASGTWGACPPASSTCTSVPVGWQPVAITETTCPDGFGSPQNYYTSATGASFTCSCGCSGTQACAGSVTLNQFGGDGGVSCTSTPTTRTIAVSPNCVSGGYGNILSAYSYTISGAAYAPAPACTASPAPTTQPAVVTQAVTVCTPSVTCPAGACLSPSQTTSLCVSQPGTKTCPAEYPTQTIMAPSYDDTRGCGPCTCGSTLSCNLTGVLLDNDNACSTGHPYEMTGTTSCAAAPSNYPLNAVQAQSTTTGDGTCAMTAPSNATGRVVLHDATTLTVCCK